MILAKTIQCRDKSARMKYKSVRPFYRGKSILEIILGRLKIINLKNIFVLTTESSVKTQEQADNMGIKVFIGDEEDVHDRFCSFCIRYQPEGVIRICADNPFISLALMHPITSWATSGLYDYISYEDAMLRHEGFFCEYISENALMDMKTKELTNYDKIHVTPYIYNHPEEYRLMILPIPPRILAENVRLTVDTIEDFKIAQKIYRAIGEKYWGNIYEYLHNKPDLLEKMYNNIKENKK